MKKCIIIHGGPLTDTPQQPHNLHQLHWHVWVADEVKKHGISCVTPPMPDPWRPQYSEWKAVLDNLLVDEETILVGHSRGAAFLPRWLGDTKQPIRKLILVAPNLRTKSINPRVQDFYDFDIDATIKNLVPERMVFISDNDEQENIESAELLAKKLDCQIFVLPKQGHFILEDMGTTAFPELVAAIIK